MIREESSPGNSVVYDMESEGRKDDEMKGMVAESSANNSIYDDDQMYRREEQMFRIRDQARTLLNKLDFNKLDHRKSLAAAHRRLSKAIDRAQNDRFNLSEDPAILDKLVESSYFYQPYDTANPAFRYTSNNFFDTIRGNRRFREPTVKIDGVTLDWGDGLNKIIVKQKEFKFEAESEAGSYIWITNKPNSHPLLVQETQTIFRREYFEKLEELFTPPCVLCLVAHNEQFKIESRVLELEVHSQQQLDENKGQMLDLAHAVRPAEFYPFDESASLGASSSSYGFMEEHYRE